MSNMSKMKKSIILKVQFPLYSDEGDLALLYSKDRSISFQAPATDMKELFAEGEYKIFVKARTFMLEGKRVVEVIKRTRNRNW